MSVEQSKSSSRSAFTLVELLVVIAIIGLLVGVLLPVFGTVRKQASVTQTNSQLAALDVGLTLFRSESSLGGTYPPSHSDNPDDPQLIADPRSNSGSTTVRITGAQLLVHAMLGADGLGTPGFRDFGTGPGRDGAWWNDTHQGQPQREGDPSGAYYIDPETGQEGHTRFTGYVDDKMKEQAKSLEDLVDKNVIVNLDCETESDIACSESVFVDPWDSPILYYRANPASFRMTTDYDDGTPGIYRQTDNAVITGSDASSPYASAGLDFGPGLADGRYHELFKSISPDATADLQEDILQEPDYEGAFARFILDPKIQARPTPARKDSFLQISAGPDARYGTEDDVTNWPRGQ